MVKVRVPASTSNLGTGFDAFGMMLQLLVSVEIEICPEGLQILMPRSAEIPLNVVRLRLRHYRVQRNLAVQSQPMKKFCLSPKKLRVTLKAVPSRFV